MLEIKGDLSLLDTLQMLKVLEGSYVIKTEDAEIHVKDGTITWFSRGDSEDCIRYVASYRGKVQVETASVMEAFSLPIEDAILQAVFLSPSGQTREEVKEVEESTCPTPETGWFALVMGDRIIGSQNVRDEKIAEVMQLWESAGKIVEGLSELMCTGKGGALYIMGEGDTVLMGYCMEKRFLGIIRQSVRRLKKHVHRGTKKQV